MLILNQDQISDVSAGNPVCVAIGVCVATYTGAAAVVDSTHTLVNFGQKIGEFVFEQTHPNPTGQMIYTENDFK